MGAEDRPLQAADAMGGSADSGAKVSGAFESRAKSSPIGGPMAQNQMQQNYAQQNALVQSPSAALDAASNKPNASSAPSSLARAGTVAESVEVQPESQAARADSRQLPLPSPMAAQSLEVGEKKEKRSGPGVMLPSGLEALSVATAASRSIAIDASGSLFRSEDAGSHWLPVKTQWTGRAVLVRTLQIDANSSLLKQRAPGFELVSDKLRSWVSTDGKTWTEKNLPKPPEP
jgi:hypothetical protein